MKTNELIKILSQAGTAKAPKPLSWALLGFLGIFTASTYFILGFRPEITTFQISSGLIMKTMLLGSICFWTAYALIQSAKPLGKPIYAKTVIAIFAELVAVLIGVEWLTRSPDTILEPFRDQITLQTCLIAVTAYGSIGAIGLVTYLRRFAPGHIKNTALLAGLCAACFGALGYSFHCPADSPTYIFLAYGLPIAFLTGLTTLIAPRFLRW